MVSVLFDSNIVIDHALGIDEASAELAAYDDAAISAITWMEATVKLDAAAIARFDLHLLLTSVKIIHTNDAIMRLASQLRSTTGKKLPDCIIRAMAICEGRTVITRNPGDFGGIEKCHVPYEIQGGKVVNVKPPLE
nr:PIN domain-containing protein [uncultured Duganella sp.]